MKKLLILSNVVLLGVIILINKGGAKSTATVSLPFSFDSCQNRLCQGYINNQVEDFTSNISYDLAVQMSQSYKADQGKKFICKGTQISKVEDASSVVFDLGLLKKYIAYIETKMCENGCSGTGVQLGIRFYCGKYPNAQVMRQNPDLRAVDPSYANRHTLFMVPVLRHLFTKEKFRDFNPEAVKANCDVSRAFNFNKKWWIMSLTTDISDDGSQENHGNLAPPPDGTGTFPSN